MRVKRGIRFDATDQMQVIKPVNTRFVIQSNVSRQSSTGLAIRLSPCPFHQLGLFKPNGPADTAIGDAAFGNHLIDGSCRDAKKLRRLTDRQENWGWL